MKVLPRYRPAPSGVGCAVHADPDCLCDVVIGTPVPIIRTGHKFHNIVLHELGDDMVSERNLHEFSSIVLGLFELEKALAAQQAPVKRKSFTALPENVMHALHNHARADTVWALASLELEGLGLSEATIGKIRADYVNMAGGIRAKRRLRGTPVPRPVTEVTEPRKRVRTPEQKAAKNAGRRAQRANRKVGKSWMEAKHTGPTLVPGTYELGERNPAQVESDRIAVAKAIGDVQ